MRFGGDGLLRIPPHRATLVSGEMPASCMGYPLVPGYESVAASSRSALVRGQLDSGLSGANCYQEARGCLVAPANNSRPVSSG